MMFCGLKPGNVFQTVTNALNMRTCWRHLLCCKFTHLGSGVARVFAARGGTPHMQPRILLRKSDDLFQSSNNVITLFFFSFRHFDTSRASDVNKNFTNILKCRPFQSAPWSGPPSPPPRYATAFRQSVNCCHF
jgi:hypothetical protein